MDDTPLATVTSRRDLSINQNESDESRSDMNLEDGKFPVLKSNLDRKVQNHPITRKISSFVIDGFCQTNMIFKFSLYQKSCLR